MIPQLKAASGNTNTGKPILYTMAMPEGAVGCYAATPKGQMPGGPKTIFFYGNASAPKGVDLSQAKIIADLTARLEALGG